MYDNKEIIPQYTINISDFTVGETVYHDRCLSASFGGTGVPSAEIPWADGEHQPWDYHYADGEFLLEPIEIPEEVQPPTEQEQLRADVDFLLMLAGEV